MFWKALVATLFLTGVISYEISEDHKAQVKKIFTEQCNRAGAPESAADGLTQATQNFATCIQQLIDVNTLKNEIEEAKPNGALDEVFKKYCAKSPQLKSCLHNLLDATEPCLDETSKPHLGQAKNGTDGLIDFVCFKDGDRIALFIAEKGPECFQSRAADARECLNKAKEGLTAENARTMTMAERCAKFDSLSQCVVTSLEKCDTPTPANMAESLLKYIRKSTPCNTQ